MAVTVNTRGGGTVKLEAGTDYVLTDGHLEVLDAREASVAIFAPGVWTQALIHSSS
ncbi:MAG: hypothetical protein LCI03_20680 [Actinobacteria bacterium]|nr:hypothetical protein [Actinomycetota bacterium]